MRFSLVNTTGRSAGLRCVNCGTVSLSLTFPSHLSALINFGSGGKADYYNRNGLKFGNEIHNTTNNLVISRDIITVYVVVVVVVVVVELIGI